MIFKLPKKETKVEYEICKECRKSRSKKVVKSGICKFCRDGGMPSLEKKNG